jgi:hypothetical protein
MITKDTSLTKFSFKDVQNINQFSIDLLTNGLV